MTMALIDCKECGNQVSDAAATCPHCGISLAEPQKLGQMVIRREWKLTGTMYSVEIIVDGKPHSHIKQNATISLELEAGKHSVQVVGGGLSREIQVNIVEGQTLRYKTYFSNMGALGGGLNLKPE